jgi:hypothetical protein
MRTQEERHSEEAEKTVRDIRRATRRQYSAKEKVRIVLARLRGEDGIAELCRNWFASGGYDTFARRPNLSTAFSSGFSTLI